MPKLKTKKTLTKRIKITGKGKVLKKHTSIGHLKTKWSASRKSRKSKQTLQQSKGQFKVFKRLLGKAGKKIK